MPETKHTKGTDSEHKIKLESSLVYAVWRGASAYAGGKAEFEIGTAFVGNGAKVKVTGQSEKGKKLGKIKKDIKNNIFIDSFEIPEDIEIGDTIYFEVDLSKNGLKGKSNSIPVFPKPVVTNLQWSAEEARRGDTLKLSADVDKATEGTEVKIIIYEYDNDGAHDRITELPATIENKKVEVEWEYEYHESTMKIPSEDDIQQYNKKEHYTHPEYFFTIEINGEKYGKKQESKLLKFKDEFDFQLFDSESKPFANEDYIIYLADGTERRGSLDEQGRGSEKDLPPGQVIILLPERKKTFGI